MVIIDRGVVEDHLPNHLLASLLRFKRQCLPQHYREEEVERVREGRRMERQERREARELTSAGGVYNLHVYCTCILTITVFPLLEVHCTLYIHVHVYSVHVYCTCTCIYMTVL